jgi:hypothetical protein
MNLLASWELFRRAPQIDEVLLKDLLAMFDQHGAHIQRNLEFSHIANSNHYLADVTGLLWLGVMLPELQAADEWREFGLRELLREMDQQTLADGTDYESSTGYHRLKLELFLYSFVLCHVNGIDIPENYWARLRGMIDYTRAYLRPDGRAPLIGDSDSGQILPIVPRRGDDHNYVLAISAAVFQESAFKLIPEPPEELLWLLGEQGLSDFQKLSVGPAPASEGFPDGGIYVLRSADCYLLFNCSDSGVGGRGSHGHNDALSIEVSACGTSFVADPGTYLYTANLDERHVFRSTGYHSTVQVDGAEQNSLDKAIPFIIGNEARPRVLSWETTAEEDLIVAEHYGYRRLPRPITHRRSVHFHKSRRFWLVTDELSGQGTHEFSFRFHFAAGCEIRVTANGFVEACDKIANVRLVVAPLSDYAQPELTSGFVSTDYGSKQPSVIACWSERVSVPLSRHWAIIPLCANEDEAAAELVAKLRIQDTTLKNL